MATSHYVSSAAAQDSDNNNNILYCSLTHNTHTHVTHDRVYCSFVIWISVAQHHQLHSYIMTRYQLQRTREFSRSQREVYLKKMWMAVMRGLEGGEPLLANVQNNGCLIVYTSRVYSAQRRFYYKAPMPMCPVKLYNTTSSPRRSLLKYLPATTKSFFLHFLVYTDLLDDIIIHYVFKNPV